MYGWLPSCQPLLLGGGGADALKVEIENQSCIVTEISQRDRTKESTQVYLITYQNSFEHGFNQKARGRGEGGMQAAGF